VVQDDIIALDERGRWFKLESWSIRMPKLLECRLDRIGKYYRWTAVFRLTDWGLSHKIAVSHHDPESAAEQLGRMLDAVAVMFSKEYGR
jgi:hypothetical protein